MRDFARLYAALDATTATNRKLAELKDYFGRAQAQDAAWAVFFLVGGKPRQAVPTKLLRQYATEIAGLDEWLFDECYHAVGDLAETIALVLPPARSSSDFGLDYWMRERIIPLRGASEAAIREALWTYWNELESTERFLLLKFIGGSFRVGVSKLLVIRALSELAAVDSKLIAQRIVGWADAQSLPSAERFAQLIAPQSDNEHALRSGQPYPFFLAHALQTEPETLGDIRDWQVEWKYDGIRAQWVARQGKNWLWSRGEELITERFPEIADLRLPDGTVLDGEIVIWKNAAPAPFAQLQQRIGRKTLSNKMRADLPAAFIAYDLLEQHGVDLREHPQAERRVWLENLVQQLQHPSLILSPLIVAPDWSALAAIRAQSRAQAAEGLILKAVNSRYGVGRTKESGVWWKWKIDPYSVDAVLIYAQAGHGRRASLYTDYTFAVWDRSADQAERVLVPFAKAYSGLTDVEIAQVDKIIRKTTLEKFGPVRSVQPSLVFEIGFEGIAISKRHKAGVAVRFPRMLRIRDDKKIEDADTLDTLKSLLSVAPPSENL